MKNLTRPKKIALVALGALAIMLAVNAPSQAAGVGGHDFGGGHGGGAVGQHGSEGHHFEGHGRFGFGPVLPFYAPYYAAPSYWYYCPSYEAYYPSVTSCPEAWVPVPAQ